jgi:hypothetical protein
MWVSFTLPWAVQMRPSGISTNWSPSQGPSSSLSFVVLALASVLIFAFGLNRLSVLRLWRWLQISALWPMLAAYFTINLVGNEGMSQFHSLRSGESLANGAGPYVCGIGLGLTVFAILIEFQSRRRMSSLHSD